MNFTFLILSFLILFYFILILMSRFPSIIKDEEIEVVEVLSYPG